MTSADHLTTLQLGTRLGEITAELDGPDSHNLQPETIAFLRAMLAELIAGADTITAAAAGSDAHTQTSNAITAANAASALAEAHRAERAEARRAELLSTLYNITCPDCSAQPGERCTTPRGTTKSLEYPHAARTTAYRATTAAQTTTEGKGDR